MKRELEHSCQVINHTYTREWGNTTALTYKKQPQQLTETIEEVVKHVILNIVLVVGQVVGQKEIVVHNCKDNNSNIG